MLYDRPYMRQSPEPAIKQASVVTVLLVLTISIFVLQHILNISFPGYGGRPNRFLTNWFAFSAENFKALKLWTVLSYAFLHSTTTIMHIVGNMLGLFFIGRHLEPLLGKSQFLLLYCSGAVVGACMYLAVHFNGSDPVVGASAAVFALVAFFCLRFPNQSITLLLFFVLPLTIKPDPCLAAIECASIQGNITDAQVIISRALRVFAVALNGPAVIDFNLERLQQIPCCVLGSVWIDGVATVAIQIKRLHIVREYELSHTFLRTVKYLGGDHWQHR